MINFNEKKGFICDMDGVIYHGNIVLPGVKDFIEWLQDNHKEYLFLTNNSSKSADKYVEKLSSLGIKSEADDFLTSVDATILFCCCSS